MNKFSESITTIKLDSAKPDVPLPATICNAALGDIDLKLDEPPKVWVTWEDNPDGVGACGAIKEEQREFYLQSRRYGYFCCGMAFYTGAQSLLTVEIGQMANLPITFS